MPIEDQMRFGNAAARAHRTQHVERERKVEKVLRQAALPRRGKRVVRITTGLNRKSSG